jgi:hypothetical protein
VPGGKLLTAPEGRLCQAMTCIGFAAPLRREERALIDEDVTDDMLGQGPIAQSQHRLPVQAGGVTIVNVSVPAAIRASHGTNRGGLTEYPHRKLRPSRRRGDQYTPSATEVQSDPSDGITNAIVSSAVPVIRRTTPETCRPLAHLTAPAGQQTPPENTGPAAHAHKGVGGATHPGPVINEGEDG